MNDIPISKQKIEKALRYKELLERAEEAKRAGKKLKFAKECGVSVHTLNRLKKKNKQEGFWGLIDRRDGNPASKNKEMGDLVKEKYVETELNWKKLRDTLVEDGVNPDMLYSERHIYLLVAAYKKKLNQVGVDMIYFGANKFDDFRVMNFKGLELLIGSYTVPGERTVRKLVNANGNAICSIELPGDANLLDGTDFIKREIVAALGPGYAKLLIVDREGMSGEQLEKYEDEARSILGILRTSSNVQKQLDAVEITEVYETDPNGNPGSMISDVQLEVPNYRVHETIEEGENRQ